MSRFISFGEQFSQEARIFALTEHFERFDFWSDILQTHDTFGVPFDLIYLKIQEAFSIPLKSEQFVEFMKMVRYWHQNYETSQNTADRKRVNK